MKNETFKQKSVEFLRDLSFNNNRDWFHKNKETWEKFLMSPARNLVSEVGSRLSKFRPQIIADPRVNQSIYRINRDIRFSKNKKPYKDHLALWWWEGNEQRLNSPGFYFHLSPWSIILSVGIYRFSPVALKNYREKISEKIIGEKFLKIIKEQQNKKINFNEPHLKRVPPGFDKNLEQSYWLRYKGLFTWSEFEPTPHEIFSEQATDFIFNYFKNFLKLHDFLCQITNKT